MLWEERESTVAQRTQRMLTAYLFELPCQGKRGFIPVRSYFLTILGWRQQPSDLQICPFKKSHGNCSRGFPPWFYGYNNTAAYSAGQRYPKLFLTSQVQQQQQSCLTSAQHSSRVGMLNFMPNLHHSQISVRSCKSGITRCHLWNRNWHRNLSPSC